MRKRNRSLGPDLLLTTTSTLENHPIEGYLGMVSGQAVVGAELYSAMFGGLRDISSGRAAAYEAQLSRAKQLAIQDMLDQARTVGADGVIAVDLDYATLPAADGTMLMVSASGTAVKLEAQPVRLGIPAAVTRPLELSIGGAA